MRYTGTQVHRIFALLMLSASAALKGGCLFAAALLALSSFSLNAADSISQNASSANSMHLVVCNSCSLSQYNDTANSLGLGTHYIADFDNNIVSGIQVTREPGYNGKYIYEDDPVAVPAYLLNGFNAWHRVFHAYGLQANSSIIQPISSSNIPAKFPTNALDSTGLDWVTGDQNLNTVDSWLADVQSSLTANGSWAALYPQTIAVIVAFQTGITAINVLGSSLSNMSIQFEITTSNGSQIWLTYTGSIPAQLNRVVDQYGNTIPLNKSQIQTSYKASNDSDGKKYLLGLAGYIHSIGATVDPPPTDYEYVYLNCSFKSNEVIECRWYPL